MELPQALLDPPPVDAAEVAIEIGEEEASLRNGMILATVSRGGRLRFFHAGTGRVLLEEAVQLGDLVGGYRLHL